MILFTTFACKENSTSISSSVPYFPVQKAGMARMEAILEGKLELDNGCLRIKYFDDNYLLIWPYGFSLRTEGEEIQVIDENGQVFARVGDNIRVGGGEITGENAKESIEKYYIETPLPEDCQGPYWVVGEVVYNGSDLDSESSDTVSSDEIDEEDELFFAEIYAEQHGITTDEALERFRLQDIAGELSEELILKEAGTLAGYWIEHTPEFKLVVLFTRNAEEIIKPYLQKYEELADIIEVGTAGLSLVELQNIQNEVSSSIEELRIFVSSDINVYENRVKIYVVDRDQLDQAVAKGKLILPDCVDVITVDSLGEELED
ncbi:MAG TPA: hypothetical protein VIH07_05740 [Candidatus Humimicrobiaceae bacterium]